MTDSPPVSAEERFADLVDRYAGGEGITLPGELAELAEAARHYVRSAAGR